MVTTPTAPLDTANSAIKPSTECASDTQLLKQKICRKLQLLQERQWICYMRNRKCPINICPKIKYLQMVVCKIFMREMPKKSDIWFIHIHMSSMWKCSDIHFILRSVVVIYSFFLMFLIVSRRLNTSNCLWCMCCLVHVQPHRLQDVNCYRKIK